MQSVRQVLDQPTIRKLLPFLLMALMLLLFVAVYSAVNTPITARLLPA